MGFSEHRRLLVDTGFETFGGPATWAGIPVRIRIRARDEDDKYGSVRLVSRSTIFRLRSWEAVAPVVGQTVTVTEGPNVGEWTVGKGCMMDEKGVWQCPVTRVAA